MAASQAGGEVSAVFDWEVTTVGDPLTDIGVSGITVENRSWYRALNAYQMAVICLIGAILVDAGHSDDHKLVIAAHGTGLLTTVGLTELGVDEKLDDGPVMPSEERMQEVQAHAADA